MKLSTIFTVSAERYVPEDDPRFGEEHVFVVTAHTTDDCPSEGWIEDIRGTLYDPRHLTLDEVSAIEQWFTAMIATSRKMRDDIQERLGEEYAERQQGLGE